MSSHQTKVVVPIIDQWWISNHRSRKFYWCPSLSPTCTVHVY